MGQVFAAYECKGQVQAWNHDAAEGEGENEETGNEPPYLENRLAGL